MTDISLTRPTNWDLATKIAAFFKAAMTRHQFNRTTHELSLLNDHVLADIGLNRADIARAATISELHDAAARR